MSDAIGSTTVGREVALVCLGLPLGRLAVRGKQVFFRYASEWLAKGFALCPSMPLRDVPYISEKLFPVFLDAAPEGWGRKLLQRAENLAAELTHRNPRLLTDFDFFVRAGNVTRQGAVEVVDSQRTSVGADPEILYDSLCRAEFGGAAEAPEALLRLVRGGTGSGGARPKFSCEIGGKLCLCKGKSRDDSFNVPVWEAVNLELARLCGLNVPEFSCDRGKGLLTVARFDRVPGGSRIPYISARTMLNTTRDDGTQSYAGIARCCDVVADKKELFGRMCFNASVGNFDDHLCNHGFLWKNGVWRLSPLFDVQPIPHEPGAAFHTIGLSNGSDVSTVENLLAEPEAFSLSLEESESILCNILRVVQENWRNLAEHYGLGDEMDMLACCYERLSPDFCHEHSPSP